MTTTRSRPVVRVEHAGPWRGGHDAPATAIDHTSPEPGPDELGTRRSILIERISPTVDGGRHAVKRMVGDELLVTADIFADGHDLLDAALLLRVEGGGARGAWREAPMRLIENDRWSGSLRVDRNARHHYAIEAWRDAFGSVRTALLKKVDGEVQFGVELEEVRLLLEATQSRAAASGRSGQVDAAVITEALAALRRARSDSGRVAVASSEELLAAVRRHPDRSAATRSAELPLTVDRERARFGAWYELFPRSQGRDPPRQPPRPSTRRAWRLPDIARMGFDVVYLPPMHPIGRTNRKGRNNTLEAKPGDPGSPYAIGSADGGHDAVAPELGGPAGVRSLPRGGGSAGHGARDRLRHPGLARPSMGARASGVVPPRARTARSSSPRTRRRNTRTSTRSTSATPRRRRATRCGTAWRGVSCTWVERGVRIFRVDNPHTKPLPFWEWLIARCSASTQT